MQRIKGQYAIIVFLFLFTTLQAKAGADIFRQRKMPVLSIGGSKDKLVQFDITQELVSELGISDENIAWYKKDTGRDSQDFSGKAKCNKFHDVTFL